MALFATVIAVLYALFVQWLWGWGTIIATWRAIGAGSIVLAIAALVGTQFIRTHRMHDYFPVETKGQFFRLYRVTQIHNILNIMMPFRTGETSFPLLMRAEFGVKLAHGTAALLVLRLLDLHALLAAGGLALVAGSGYRIAAIGLWSAFVLLPVLVFPFSASLLAYARARLPARFSSLVDGVAAGIPSGLTPFFRAWLLTVFNWAVKVVVLVIVLALMGVLPLAACFGGAVGGELSSVLPVHAPAGVGTYPAGIVAGAIAFGAARLGAAFDLLARAAINAHLLIVVSALAATGFSLLMPLRLPAGRTPSKTP
jgi:uncharacterized membrane protein YbhN (UPF0104 family)